MNKTVIISLFLIIILLVGGVYLFMQFRPAINPALGPAAYDIVEEIDRYEAQLPGENNTGFPLQIPNGTRVNIFADELNNARFMAFDSNGVLYLSQPKEGRVVALPDANHDGVADKTTVALQGLDRPHGIAFVRLPYSRPLSPAAMKEPTYHIAVLPVPTSTPPVIDEESSMNDAEEIREYLYVAESGQVVRYTHTASGFYNKEVIVNNLPAGGTHWTRSLAIKDNKLYVSIGSSCNVCNEDDLHRASVWEYRMDGSNGRIYATGLRNSVGFAIQPDTHDIFMTENGRDQLGDDVPPDEINILREGANYGWPTCYGDNIHDTGFDKNTYIRNPCEMPFETPSTINLQAHVAPLGLTFYSGTEFPEYSGDLFVALHGSWNRSVPVGYKVIRIESTPNGYVQHDFISGWLVHESGDTYSSSGRPVDITVGPQGDFYISDDKAGVVYRVSKQ